MTETSGKTGFCFEADPGVGYRPKKKKPACQFVWRAGFLNPCEVFVLQSTAYTYLPLSQKFAVGRTTDPSKNNSHENEPKVIAFLCQGPFPRIVKPQ